MIHEFFSYPFLPFVFCFRFLVFRVTDIICLSSRGGYSFRFFLFFPLPIAGSGTLYRVFCIAFPFPYCAVC